VREGAALLDVSGAMTDVEPPGFRQHGRRDRATPRSRGNPAEPARTPPIENTSCPPLLAVRWRSDRPPILTGLISQGQG
jgi:hypothetical protein